MGKNTITRRLFAAFSRYRPRVLTLAVLAAVAGMIVVANLSEAYNPREVTQAPLTPANWEFDLGEPGGEELGPFGVFFNMSYGWPLRWHQYVLGTGPVAVVGECHSAGRLVGNLALWLIMMSLPAGVCEWLLRRYRLRVRFSLRTILAATGLAAALCAWFAAARDRANVQDPLIDGIEARKCQVWVERWGPKWLEHLGTDRYRRRIVGAELYLIAADEADEAYEADEREDQRLLDELKRLPDLRYLSLEADRISPRTIDAVSKLQQIQTLRINVGVLTRKSGQALGDALSGMPRLHGLSIEQAGDSLADDDLGIPRECLTGIGAMPQLEHLRLYGWTIASQDLALLAGLTNLKSLTLHGIFQTPYSDPLLLARLPAMPRLEDLSLEYSGVFDGDLPYIAALPRLKSLNLLCRNITGAGLAELEPLGSLEELAIKDEAASAAGFESVLKLKVLKILHVEYFDQSWPLSRPASERPLGQQENKIDGLRRALHALRNSKPGLLIDAEVDAIGWYEGRMAPKCETIPDDSDDWLGTSAREVVGAWKEKQAAN